MSFPHYYDMLRHYTRDALQAKIHLIGHQEAFWQTNLSKAEDRLFHLVKPAG